MLQALHKPKNALAFSWHLGGNEGPRNILSAQVSQLSKALMWKGREQKEVWKPALGQ